MSSPFHLLNHMDPVDGYLIGYDGASDRLYQETHRQTLKVQDNGHLIGGGGF